MNLALPSDTGNGQSGLSARSAPIPQVHEVGQGQDGHNGQHRDDRQHGHNRPGREIVAGEGGVGAISNG
jgi:hypothetical protein